MKRQIDPIPIIGIIGSEREVSTMVGWVEGYLSAPQLTLRIYVSENPRTVDQDFDQ
jgi:hypothetical protein